MAMPQREEGGGREGAPQGTTAPGRSAIAARWALVAAAAALALFSAARALGLLDEPTSSRSTGNYVCPMHPEVAKGEPGVCPVCGMRLEEKVAPPAASPARAVPVRRARLARSVSAPATIAVPDGRLVSVSVRAQGWIASLPVAEVGRRVERGQVLATVDSPELFRLQQKFLNAVRWSRAGAPNIQPSHAGDSTGDLVAEATLQLRLAGFADADIAALDAAARPRREVAVRAPAGGVVVRKQAERGGFAAVGQELFAIAELGAVWALAEVPEAEVARLRVGGRARVQPPAGPPIDGAITFIHPTAEEGSRTVRVRVELPNPDGALRPGTSATVDLAGADVEVLVVPATSVVDTGGRAVVFVAGRGADEPRPVVLGARIGLDVEVVNGLSEGELVVGEGAFLLEAESRLRAARPGR